MKSKPVTPKWVDRLLILVVISILRFLIKHGQVGICKDILLSMLSWALDLMAALSPLEGRASRTSSRKRHSL